MRFKRKKILVSKSNYLGIGPCGSRFSLVGRWYANGPAYYALFKPQMTMTNMMKILPLFTKYILSYDDFHIILIILIIIMIPVKVRKV